MKRFFQILGILLLLIIAAMFFLPIVFKDEIIARAKDEMNKNLTATVNFEDIDISLFRSFPDFTLRIEKLTIDGQNDFEGVRLLETESFQVELGLFSVISGNKFEVESVDIEGAGIYLLVNEDGKLNYDIVKSDSAASTGDTATPSNFKLSLREYSLHGEYFIYEDRQADVKMLIRDFTHQGSGDFTEEVFTLDTKTIVENFTLSSGGIAYLEEVKVKGDMLFEFNQPEFKLTFLENKMYLNELVLNFNGFMAMPADDISMDITFNSPDSDFRHILSLIPSVYSKDFSDVQTSGKFSLAGNIKGVYDYEDVYPSFDFKLDVENGTFKYPNMPADVKNINLKAHISNPSDNLDATVINIPKASANVGGSPVDARLSLRNPMSDPAFIVFLKTDFQLENIGKVIPASGYDYRGHIKANLDLAGKMSDLDNENYEAVKAEGEVMAENVVIKNDSLPFPVEINRLQMAFAPQKVSLNTFESKFGESDISANGTLDNLLSYMLDDRTLTGNFSMTSGYLNLNQLTQSTDNDKAAVSSEKASGSSADTSAMEVVRLPENVDFTLSASIDKLLYDNLEISNVKGQVTMQEGTAKMENMVMELLGGSMALSGTYHSLEASPGVDMNIKIKDFSFAESFKKLNTLRSIAPIIESTTGNYSTGLSFSSKLNPDMSPDLSSILAQGSLVTEKMVTSPKVLNKLATMLKNPSLSTLDIGKMNLSFKVEDGRVNVDPFNINAGNVSAVVSGSNGLDQSLDYTMLMKLPVNGINAEELLNKVGAAQGGKVELAVKITGTYKDPKVSTSLGDIFGNVVDNIKDKIDEVKKEAVDKINIKAQELIDNAVAKGDQLIAVAVDQANRIRSEAQKQADKLVSEADNRAAKLEEEAKGNFLKEKGASVAADKIRSEARDKANKVMAEANKKADNLVITAEQQKEKLVEEARQKAKLENP